MTSGAQQAIALVAQLFRGERVAMEDPTNPASLDAFRAAGADIVAIGVDDDGAIVDELERLPAARMPAARLRRDDLQQPDRHRALAGAPRRARGDGAQREGWTIVEDETLCDISMHDVDPPLPIAALDSGATVLTIGSACKLFWGGLRIGWVRGEAHMISRIAPLKIVADLGTSLVGQALCAELLPLRDRVRARTARATRGALSHARRRARTRTAVVEPQRSARRLVALDRAAVRRFRELRRRSRALRRDASHPVRSSLGRAARAALAACRSCSIPTCSSTGVERLAAAWNAYAPRAATLPLDAVVVKLKDSCGRRTSGAEGARHETLSCPSSRRRIGRCARHCRCANGDADGHARRRTDASADDRRGTDVLRHGIGRGREALSESGRRGKSRLLPVQQRGQERRDQLRNPKYFDSPDAGHPQQLWYDVNGKLLGGDWSQTVASSPNGPTLFGLSPSRFHKIPLHIHYGAKRADGSIDYGLFVRASDFTAAGLDPLHPTAADLVKLGKVTSADKVAFVFALLNNYDAQMWVIPNATGQFADLNPGDQTVTEPGQSRTSNARPKRS